MLQYDLTDTLLLDDPTRDVLPTEAELMTLSVALLLHYDCGLSDVHERALDFRAADAESIARIIEGRLAPLAREFGSSDRLRTRLKLLVGLRMQSYSHD